jgi:hypothetical protein
MWNNHVSHMAQERTVFRVRGDLPSIHILLIVGNEDFEL